MSKEFILKKRIFGGFDRRQVIECIAELQTKYADSDKHNEVLQLEEQISNLQANISEKDEKLKALKNKLDELNALSASSKNPADTFNTLSQADKIIDSAKKEAAQYIKNTDSYIKNSSKEFELLLSKITNLNNEITEMGTDASRISDNLSKVSVEEIQKNENIVEENESKPTTSNFNDTVMTSDSTEEDIAFEDENADIFLSSDLSDTEAPPLYNSIDNFFAELEKLTDSK